MIRCPPQRTLDTRSVCSTSDTAPLPGPTLKTTPCSLRAWEGGEGKSGGAGHNAVHTILQESIYHILHTPILVSDFLYTNSHTPVLHAMTHVYYILFKGTPVSPVHTFQNLCKILIHTNIHTAMHPYLHHHIPIEAAIDAGCISSLADLVSVHYQDGCTDKEVEGELKIHHPSSWPHLSPCGKVGKAQELILSASPPTRRPSPQ